MLIATFKSISFSPFTGHANSLPSALRNEFFPLFALECVLDACCCQSQYRGSGSVRAVSDYGELFSPVSSLPHVGRGSGDWPVERTVCVVCFDVYSGLACSTSRGLWPALAGTVFSGWAVWAQGSMWNMSFSVLN